MTNFYTPLHVHTSRGSLLDSTNTPQSLVKRAKELGLKSIAITDHGYCSNHVEFYKECKANGIKPILGMEGYIANDMTIKDREQGFYHIILLAKNNKGYRNLLKISSLGHTKGFYYKPRVDLKTIRELNLGEGIVATSACFTKGNKVLTSKGYKNIEDIQMGDKVMNAKGDWERVDYPTTRAYQDDGFVITNTGDERNITCTANHKFWVADNNNRKPRWETAQQIFEANTKRYMLYPIKVDYNTNKKTIHREEWHDSAVTTDSRLLKYQLPDIIELTPELMRLLGMFIGDGSISITPKSKKICWTLNERDYPQFEPIVKAVERQLGIQFYVLTRSKNCRVDVSTSSLDFVNFMYYLFGNCIANTKHIPLRLRNISMALDCELLFGYFMTDGYSRIRDKDGYSYGENVFCSVSEKLIDDVQKIFATMGMRCRRHSNPPYRDKWGVNHQKSYYLTLNGMYLASLSKSQFYSHEDVVLAFNNQIEASSDRTIECNGQKYLKIYIREIKPIQLNTQVYCLHNQSHSFVVNNSIVHNCMGGQLPQMILQDKPMGSILNKIQEYKDTFEYFYLELQPINTPDNEQTKVQQFVNAGIVELANITNTQLVATSDCHFTNKEDFDLHNVFIQISQDRDNEVYENCWLKSYDEMLNGDYFGEYQENDKELIEQILDNTNDIAIMCNVELEMGKSYIPSAKLPKGKKKEQYFLELIVNGCNNRGFDKFDKDKKELYWNRIKSEFEVLKVKGFIDYFLLEYNIIHTARKNGIIISPTARGSGAGSLICYVLGLTHVDPIKYHLLFERFLTIEKKGLPDIDTDVATQDKDRLADLIKDMYGHNKVAQIATFGTLQSKSAIQSIGKVLDIPYKTVEEIKKGITDGLSIKESLETNKDLQQYKELYPKLFDYAVRLEGLERNISTHAGGVVITPKDKTMSDFCGMSISRKEEEITQLDMGNCEEVGLVKMDFLGLSTLDVIYDTYKIIKETQDIDIELKPETLNFDDKKTYEMLIKGHTKGVFQLGSKGITDACKELKPDTFDELTNLVSLYRPATLKALERYIKKKQGELKIKSIEPRIDEVLSTTMGELIYQEQMMRLLKIMANFSDGEADHARKISSKKKVEEFEKVMQDFKKRAKENGFTDKAITTVYDMIKDSASYSFALAHGVSYTMLTYITAYLKANYTTEFMCSLLTNQRKEGSTDMESLNEYIKECIALGIKLKNPDLRVKNFDFKVTGDKEITYGLDLIKGCNKSELEELIKYDFNSMGELLEVSQSKNTLIPLIKTGALDYLGERKQLLIDLLAYRYNNGLEKKKNLKNVNKKHYEQLLKDKKITLADIPQDNKDIHKKEKILNIINKENKKEVYQDWKENILSGDYAIWEYQLLGYTLTGELFQCVDKFVNFFKEDFQYLDLPCIVNKIDKKKIKKGKSKGQEMAILDLDTPFGEIRALCFATNWQTLKYKIDKGERYILCGTKKDNQLIITGFMSYERYINNFKK